MAFTVGDIEAKLTLDRTPFREGLDAAREDVKRFEDERHEVTEHVNLAGLQEAKLELDRLSEEMKARLRVNADDAEAKLKLDQLKVELDEIGRKHETAHVDVDTSKADANVRQLTGSVTRLGAAASVIGRATMPALIAGLVGLATTAVPAAGAAAAGIAGMGVAFGLAGAAAGVFGLAVKSQWKNIETAATGTGAAQQKAMAALGPGGAQAVAALKGVQSQWKGVQEAVRPYLTQLITIGSQTLGVLMPTIRSLGVSAGQVFTQLAGQARTALAGPFWQQFLGFVRTQAPVALRAFGMSFGNVAHGMAGLTMAFQPLEQRFLGGMQRMTGAFSHWSDTLASSPGFKSFMAEINRDIPAVMGFLKAFGGAAVQLANQLLPVGRAVLTGLTPVFAQLKRDLPAMQPGFQALGRFAVALLRNIEPLLPALARLIAALEPIATVLVNSLGSALRAVAPLLEALIRAITPAAQIIFPLLARVIAQLAPMFAQLVRTAAPFVTTIARVLAAILPGLATVLVAVGRGFITILNALRPIQAPLIQLAVSFGRLLATVAPAMAQMLAAIAPVVAILAGALAPVIRLVASLLSSSLVRSVLTAMTMAIMPLGGALMVLGAVFNVLKGIASAVASAVVAVWHVAEAGLKAVWNVIASAARTVWNLIKGYITGPVQAVWSFIESAFHSWLSVASSVWHAIASVASSAWNAVKGAITGPVQAVWNFVDGAWHAIESAASAAWSAIRSAASAAWNAITGAITGPVNSVLHWFAGIFNWFVTAGENIVKGLIDGVGAMAGWLIKKVEDLASSALSAIGKVFGIGSPSRVMHGYGRNLMEGLANGMLAGAPGAISAALRASRGVLGAFGGQAVSPSFSLMGGPSSVSAAAPVGVGGGVSITLHVDTMNAGNPNDLGRVQQMLVSSGRQITRAQGRRGG